MTPLQFLLVYIVGIAVLLYFMTILPGKRKNKKMQELHASIAVGDEIATAGGVIGTVVARDSDVLKIRIDDEANVTMRIVVYAVSSILTKSAS